MIMITQNPNVRQMLLFFTTNLVLLNYSNAYLLWSLKPYSWQDEEQ